MRVRDRFLATVAPLIVVLLAGCGAVPQQQSGGAGSSATSSTTSSAPSPSTQSTTAPATPSGVPTGWKPVTYSGVSFAVPQDWPVHDLTTDPRQCVRFDVHAVYLGHAGAAQDCPARVIGKTDALHVEPYDAQARQHLVLGPQPTMLNGQSVLTDPSAATTHSIVVAFQDLGVVATLTYTTSAALDQTILETFRKS